MGPSGSGKSTLMHCLAGLDTPTSRSVRIGDTEISHLGDRALTLLGQVIRNGRAPGIGINVASDPLLRGFTVASGHLPSTAGQVAVDKATAGVSQTALTARIAALPGLSGYQVQTGSQLATSEANAAVHFTRQFTTVILVFALIALVVACIVIYNTFTILITQRGRELALLRCVGASGRQVFAGTLLESLIVGLVASAAGVVAGIGLGWALQRLFSGFGASVPAGPVVLTPSTVAISMAADLAVTVVAAVVPARSATRVAPVAALGGQHEPAASHRVGWLRVTVAVVFTAGGTLLTYTGMQHVDKQSGFVRIAAGGCVCFVAWPCRTC